MSINDITQAAQRLNQAADAYHGKIADINARIAAKENAVDTFLADANSKFEFIRLETSGVVDVPGDADKYYPVVFNAENTINQFTFRRSVNGDQDIYGRFNGSLMFDGIYQHSSDGVYAGGVYVRWHKTSSYSPDIPATPQFVARMAFVKATRDEPEETRQPCVWLRGRTSYSYGLTAGGLDTCNGDGIVNGRDYGVLQSDFVTEIPFKG